MKYGWFVLGCLGFLASTNAGRAENDNGKRRPRVGQVIIVGNTVTHDRVIRDIVNLYPGELLQYPMLRIAEAHLARRGIFKVDPATGVRPTVAVIESANEFRDILVTVEEAPSGTVMLHPQVNAHGELVLCLRVRDTNFDPWAFPLRLTDISAQRAFRGAGLDFRLEVVQLPLVPWRTTSALSTLSTLSRNLGWALLDTQIPEFGDLTLRILNF